MNNMSIDSVSSAGNNTILDIRLLNNEGNDKFQRFNADTVS